MVLPLVALLLGVAFNGWSGMQLAVRLTSAARAGAIQAANELGSATPPPTPTVLNDATNAINAEEGVAGVYQNSNSAANDYVSMTQSQTTSSGVTMNVVTITISTVGLPGPLRGDLPRHGARHGEVLMTRVVPKGEEGERGVVLIIVAVAMVVLLGLIAIAIDGSYGFVQNRRAQNATDFAAFAAAQQLDESTYCNGTRCSDHAADHRHHPEARRRQRRRYRDQLERSVRLRGRERDPQFDLLAGQQRHARAAPGRLRRDDHRHPDVVAVLRRDLRHPPAGGIRVEQGARNTATGQPIGIVALNKVGPHEILGGGTGTFVVSGSIVLNTNVTNQPWSGSRPDGRRRGTTPSTPRPTATSTSTARSTAIGTLNGQNLWPLDTCFENNGIQGQGNPCPDAARVRERRPDRPGLGLAGEPDDLHGVTGDHRLQQHRHLGAQISDPLPVARGTAEPAEPSTNIACPGSPSPTVFSGISGVLSGTQNLQPGIYPNPVELTGSATFQDCPGPDGGYPGIYQFDQGLWINPQSASDTVTGIQRRHRHRDAVPRGRQRAGFGGRPGAFTASGAGNGAPCLPSRHHDQYGQRLRHAETETSSAASAVCGGTNPTDVRGHRLRRLAGGRCPTPR